MPIRPATIAITLCLVLGTLALPSFADEPGAWDRFKQFAHTQKTEAMAEGRRLIAETDRQIDALQRQIDRSTAETRVAHERNMKELRARKATAEAELARLGQATGNAWDATKEGFSNAYRELRKAYDKAAAGG